MNSGPAYAPLLATGEPPLAALRTILMMGVADVLLWARAAFGAVLGGILWRDRGRAPRVAGWPQLARFLAAASACLLAILWGHSAGSSFGRLVATQVETAVVFSLGPLLLAYVRAAGGQARISAWHYLPAIAWLPVSGALASLGRVAVIPIAALISLQTAYTIVALVVSARIPPGRSCEYRREPVSEHPAYLFRISARDLARYGLLFLRKGRWGDQQILAAEWIQASTHPQVRHRLPFPYNSYGYLWWTFSEDENIYPGDYLSTGDGGQLLYVSPREGLVVVALAETRLRPLRMALGRDITNQQRWDLWKKIRAGRRPR